MNDKGKDLESFRKETSILSGQCDNLNESALLDNTVIPRDVLLLHSTLNPNLTGHLTLDQTGMYRREDLMVAFDPLQQKF